MSETGAVSPAEFRLLTETLGSQIKGLGEGLKDFMREMTASMQDVRDRLTRMESANDKIEKLETDLVKANDQITANDRRLIRIETIIAPLTVIGAALASGIVTLILQKLSS